MRTVNLVISGRVQGVFFRATAQKVAKSLQLAGWVKNAPNGKVETVVQGKTEQINRFIEWCKVGPEKANVSSVQIMEIEGGEFQDFQIVR